MAIGAHAEAAELLAAVAGEGVARKKAAGERAFAARDRYGLEERNGGFQVGHLAQDPGVVGLALLVSNGRVVEVKRIDQREALLLSEALRLGDRLSELGAFFVEPVELTAEGRGDECGFHSGGSFPANGLGLAGQIQS